MDTFRFIPRESAKIGDIIYRSGGNLTGMYTKDKGYILLESMGKRFRFLDDCGDVRGISAREDRWKFIRTESMDKVKTGDFIICITDGDGRYIINPIVGQISKVKSIPKDNRVIIDRPGEYFESSEFRKLANGNLINLAELYNAV